MASENQRFVEGTPKNDECIRFLCPCGCVGVTRSINTLTSGFRIYYAILGLLENDERQPIAPSVGKGVKGKMIKDATNPLTSFGKSIDELSSTIR